MGKEGMRRMLGKGDLNDPLVAAEYAKWRSDQEWEREMLISIAKINKLLRRRENGGVPLDRKQASELLRSVRTMVNTELRDLAFRKRKGVRGCPRCKGIEDSTELPLDQARIAWTQESGNIEELRRMPDGRWIARMRDGSDVVGWSLRQTIDQAAEKIDHELRPTLPVKFRARLRRIRVLP